MSLIGLSPWGFEKGSRRLLPDVERHLERRAVGPLYRRPEPSLGETDISMIEGRSPLQTFGDVGGPHGAAHGGDDDRKPDGFMAHGTSLRGARDQPWSLRTMVTQEPTGSSAGL